MRGNYSFGNDRRLPRFVHDFDFDGGVAAEGWNTGYNFLNGTVAFEGTRACNLELSVRRRESGLLTCVLTPIQTSITPTIVGP